MVFTPCHFYETETRRPNEIRCFSTQSGDMGVVIFATQGMPVPQQLSQVPTLRTRYPDPGKAIFQHQLQDQLRILPIRFLLAHALRADLRCILDPQLFVHRNYSNNSSHVSGSWTTTLGGCVN